MSDQPTTREELEEAFRGTVDAVGYADPAEAAAGVAARVEESVDQVQDGTHLVAGDGTRYVVSNLNRTYVPVRTQRPVNTLGTLDELFEVKPRTTLTLRRVFTREEQLAARKEEKRMRKLAARVAAPMPGQVDELAPVNWDAIDQELVRKDAR